MRISTSIKTADLASIDAFLNSFEQIVQTNLAAGFDALDMSFSRYTRRPSPLVEADWLDWLQKLADLNAQLDVTWSQGHAHFVDWEEVPLHDWEWHDELVRRSVVGAGLFGVKWLVIHPRTRPDYIWYSSKASLKSNLEMFNKYGEWAAEHGVKIAIENMIEKKVGRRFGSSVEELLELHERLDSDLFGICWDTGHAHMAGINQPAALHLIGKRLKALHICDNHGVEDEHLMPLAGTIDWQPIMQALVDIEYTGDLTFEVAYRDKGQHYRMYELHQQLLYETGVYLRGLARNTPTLGT